MCIPKQKKTAAVQEAPDPAPNASAVSTPTLDMALSQQKRGKSSLSLRRNGGNKVGHAVTAGLATETRSGLGT